ncbi:MAG: c-type cytochrome [Gemmatimonadaceae bacterium]
MRPAIRFSLLSAALAAIALGAVYGGWAVTTVDDFPDAAVAGKPLTLSWKVRQHGVELLGGLRGTVEAVSGNSRVAIPASRGAAHGQYTATITLPTAGQWTIAIRHGFGDTRRELPPLRVVSAASALPAALPDVERGARMFVTKGCITCHAEIPVGPPLAGRRYDDTWLASFLANPTRTPGLRKDADPMPNLGLQPREVAALVAFVNGPRQAAQR